MVSRIRGRWPQQICRQEAGRDVCVYCAHFPLYPLTLQRQSHNSLLQPISLLQSLLFARWETRQRHTISERTVFYQEASVLCVNRKEGGPGTDPSGCTERFSEALDFAQAKVHNLFLCFNPVIDLSNIGWCCAQFVWVFGPQSKNTSYPCLLGDSKSCQIDS